MQLYTLFTVKTIEKQFFPINKQQGIMMLKALKDTQTK